MLHFIKNNVNVNCLCGGSILYNDNIIICVKEIIPLIPESMVIVYFFKMNKMQLILNSFGA